MISQDGSRNYTTIRAAITATSNQLRSSRYVTYVKARIYRENVQIESHLRNITLLGDRIANTIVTAKNSKGGNTTTYRLAIDGKCLFSKLLSLMLFLSMIKKLRYLFELYSAY